MSIDITIEEMEALPAESYELFDIRGEIERAHGILPNSVASSADALMENPPEDKEKKIIICCSRGQIRYSHWLFVARHSLNGSPPVIR